MGEEQQKELDLGRVNRARKDVTYQEQLSERDWLKAIGAEEEGSDSDSYDDTASERRGGGRGGGKKKRRDDDEDDDEPRRKKKKGNRAMLRKMKKLIEVVNEYQDADGRILSAPSTSCPPWRSSQTTTRSSNDPWILPRLNRGLTMKSTRILTPWKRTSCCCARPRSSTTRTAASSTRTALSSSLSLPTRVSVSSRSRTNQTRTRGMIRPCWVRTKTRGCPQAPLAAPPGRRRKRRRTLGPAKRRRKQD